MRDRYSPCIASLPNILPLIDEVVGVRRPIDLVNWLKGDIQLFLPHDLLLSVWGDFQFGLIQYEVISTLPGIGFESAAATPVNPLFTELFDHWIKADCKPVVLHSNNQRPFVWNQTREDVLTRVMGSMRTALIHGIRDHRNRQDCLFALYSKLPQCKHRHRIAMKWLLPYIDAALRQIRRVPTTYPSVAVTTDPGSKCVEVGITANEKFELSQHEIEIMKWVTKGKSNAEISNILNVSTFTVKSHMQGIFKKLDVFSRAQAVLAFSGIVKSTNAG